MPSRARANAHIGIRSSWCSLALRLLLAATLAMSVVASVCAQSGSLRGSSSVGPALLISRDQLGRMGFQSLGALAELHVGYALSSFVDLQLGGTAAGFSSATSTGALLSPSLGLRAGYRRLALRPYAELDLGPGFTGRLLRPFLRAAFGVEVKLTDNFAIGPKLGYGQLFQYSSPGASTDARFLWLGLCIAFHPEPPEMTQVTRYVDLYRHHVIYDHAPPEDASSSPPTAAIEPSPELLALIDEAVPASQVELLAPVLFKFDADALEAIGVAMLHEVARELGQRKDIELLEIQGYADARGPVDYNRALSGRRAQRVLAWLVEHGVARERLRVAAEGASGFVEPGHAEPAHQQNRRVVFRVIRTGTP